MSSTPNFRAHKFFSCVLESSISGSGCTQLALTRWRSEAVPKTSLLVGHVGHKDWLGWCETLSSSLFHKASCRPSELLGLRSWIWGAMAFNKAVLSIWLMKMQLYCSNSTPNAEYQSCILELCWTHSNIWPFVLHFTSPDHHPVNLLECNRRIHVFFKGLVDQIMSLHTLLFLYSLVTPSKFFIIWGDYCSPF